VLSDTIVLGLAAPVTSSYLDGRTRQVMNLEESAVSVYRVTDLIGTSTESWQDAATTAITEARKTLRNLRVAEVVEQDIDIDEGGAFTYRTKLRVSFKYESEQ
jgi:dodecin